MKSIKGKLSLFIFITVLLAILIVTTITFLSFYKSTIQQNSENYSMLAGGYQQAVDNKINIYKKQLEMVAKQDGITSDELTADEKNDLLNTLAENSGFNYISVSDASGQTYRNSDISDRVYFKKALAGTYYMSDPVINKVDGKLTFMFAVPVQNGTGFKGVVYGGISYDEFISDLISTIEIGDAGYAIMVNSSGTIIASPDLVDVTDGTNYITMSQEDSQYDSAAAVTAKMTEGKAGVDFMQYDGKQWLVAYTPLSGPEGCSIALLVPQAQVMHDYMSTIKQCAIISILLIFTSLIISIILCGKMTRPIIRAVERIKQLAQGDLYTQVDQASGKDEIAELTRALHLTVLQLQSYIEDISDVLSSMADGNYAVQSSVTYTGDFLPIKEALTTIQCSLRDTLSLFNTSTQHFDSTAVQMEDASQTLAQGATAQAGSIEELAATITKVLDEVSQNSEYAHAAKQLADKAKVEVDYGNKQMEEMNNAMNEINTSSIEISKIIRVIDDIAFQTNILALNAAVEAARAGTAGKGFAVVADEVRNLASKSAEAAKTTAKLISSSQSKTAEGAQIADATAKTLKTIVLSMTQIVTLIEKMNMASDNQKSALELVSHEATQISSVVQTNSATAEENSALSFELASQAKKLYGELNKFKV
jgi:methyl-accepting chemotaxis protein